MADTVKFQRTSHPTEGGLISIEVDGVAKGQQEQAASLIKECVHRLTIGLCALDRLKEGPRVGYEDGKVVCKNDEFIEAVTTALDAVRLNGDKNPLKPIYAYAWSRGYAATAKGAAYAFAASVLEEMMLGNMPPPGSGLGVVKEGLTRVKVSTNDGKPKIEIHIFENDEYRAATWNVTPMELVGWLASGDGGTNPLTWARRRKGPLPKPRELTL